MRQGFPEAQRAITSRYSRIEKNEWINEKEKLRKLGGAAAILALGVISATAVYRMMV